jgi:hypothetical protein
MKIQILNRWNNTIIFEGDFDCMLSAVREAISKSADLYGANLSNANLYGANLSNANLCSANLRSANLCSADLRSANLCSANLGGAKGINPLLTTQLYLLKEQVGKIRAYKMVDAEFRSPINNTKITYEIGKTYRVKDANTDEQEQCAAGISLASAGWIIANWKPGYRVLIAEHTTKDIAAIPIGSDGKYRVFRAKIVGEKPLAELGIEVQP